MENMKEPNLHDLMEKIQETILNYPLGITKLEIVGALEIVKQSYISEIYE